MQDQNPINPLPPVVVALVLVVIGVEAALSMAAQGWIGGPQGVGWRLAAIEDYGVWTPVFDWMIERGDFSPDLLKRFVTYPFVHGSMTHAIFGAVLLLALGKFVGEVFHPVAVLLLFFGSAIAGGLVYTALLASDQPLYGAYPPVYGLIGAFTYLMWLRLGAVGANQFRAFLLIGILLGWQLLTGILFGGSPQWVADVTGFGAGLALAPLVGPGGWAAFLRRIRQR